MKKAEENNERIDKIQEEIQVLKVQVDERLKLIGEKQEELQQIQSENLIMAEEMRAGKNLD